MTVHSVRSLLIRLAVSLQFWPFTVFFAAFYRLAIRTSIFFVSRIPGVVALYLSGSLAKSTPIYGLSDIDFTIFVRGPKSEDTVRRIRHLFLRLRTCFPMLGAAEEKGVYFLRTFVKDYDRFPMIQHLFDGDFYRHKFLFGNDILAEVKLPPLSDEEVLITYLWKLRYWTEKVLYYLESERLSDIQELHTYFKALGNIGRIYQKLRVSGTDGSGPREDLLLARNVVEDSDAPIIDALVAAHDAFYRKSDVTLEETFLLFKNMVAGCVVIITDRIGRVTATRGHGVPRQSVPTHEVEVVPKPEWLNGIAELCAPGTTVRAFRSASVPINTLDCAYFDTPTYIVTCDTPLTREQAKALQGFYRRRMAAGARLLIQESPNLLYALHSDMLEHWMITSVEEQYLLQTSNLDLGKNIDAHVVSGMIKRIGYQIPEIRALASGGDISRLDGETFWRFFFSSLQRLILYRSLHSGRFFLPSTVQAICTYLLENTPLTPGFVDLLRAQDPGPRPCKPEARSINLKKARLLMREFSERVANGDTFARLEPINALEDHARLKISVVVVTRNRCQQLKRCLHSIGNQTRPPDEVLIVDNGSTDATRDVVSTFSGPATVSYAHEPTPGVACARNRGMQDTTGDIVAFLDDDAVADEAWLFNLERPFLKDDRIGIVGGRIHHMVENRSDVVYRYHAMQEGVD